MTVFINTETNQYPLDRYQATRTVRGKAGIIAVEASDETLASHGVFPVTATQRPNGDVVKEVLPVYNEESKQWVQAWETRDFTEDELENISEERKQTLLQSALTALYRTRSQGYEFITEEGVVDHVQLRDSDRVNLMVLDFNLSKGLLSDEEGNHFLRGLTNVNHVMTVEALRTLIAEALAFDAQVFTKYLDLKKGILEGTITEVPELIS